MSALLRRLETALSPYAGMHAIWHPAHELEREIVALSESKRTESIWVKTTAYDGKTGDKVAEMILNSATLKNSYAKYDEEAKALGKPA